MGAQVCGSVCVLCTYKAKHAFIYRHQGICVPHIYICVYEKIYVVVSYIRTGRCANNVLSIHNPYIYVWYCTEFSRSGENWSTTSFKVSISCSIYS